MPLIVNPLSQSIEPGPKPQPIAAPSGSILLHHTGLAAQRAMECTAFIAEITTASTPAPVAVPAPTTIRPGTGVLTPGTHCPRATPYTFPFCTRAKRENVGGVATS